MDEISKRGQDYTSASACGAKVAVIIPTHNRVESLRDVLEGLSGQTYDLSQAEVIVVVDGSTDGTRAVLEAENFGLNLQVIYQPQSGVAVARNQGAAAARAPVLIFLDDDVTPAPGLLEAYVRLQNEANPCVAFGRLMPSKNAHSPGWSRWLEWQLVKQYEAMLRGDRAVDGRSLYSGNFSLPRGSFCQVGGFDEAVRSCEDTDLGLRLQRAGARFELCPEAIGYHRGFHDYESWRATAYRDGQWDADRALKLSYPYGWQDLLKDFHRRNTLVRISARALLDRRRLFWLNIRVLRLAALVAGWLRLVVPQRLLYGGIYNLIYWQAVCDGIGGADLLRRYLGYSRTGKAGR